MARIFVTSDNQAARVEIVAVGDEGEFAAICLAHTRGRPWTNDDSLVRGLHERWNLADTIEVATSHADTCVRCASPDCSVPDPHIRHDRALSDWPDPDARPTY